MKRFKANSSQPVVFVSLMLTISWLVAGCSGSSTADTPVGQTPVDATTAEANDTEATSINGDGTSTDSLDAIEAQSNGDNGDAEIASEEEADEVSNPVVVDPLIQNRIPVTFEITVPFYLSNELRVDLMWGETQLTAMWVGGQFWSVTGEFPTNTEHPLEITFYDNNGAVELARYNQSYRVGSNASEIVQIPAEQFDANLFDSDGDGVNNLDELNSGTDPFTDEDSLLEIVDAFAISNFSGQYSRISVSRYFESFVQQGRPYIDTYEIEPFLNATLFGQFNINIDIDGNGTLNVNSEVTASRFIPLLSATRANLGNAITWMGELQTSDSDFVHIENVTNTVSEIDDNFRSFVQEVTGRNSGPFRFTWESSANLTGRLIEGSSLCEPVAGTFTETRQSNLGGSTTAVTTVSKEIDDLYWRVVTTTDESETIEYFARELRILHDPTDEESALFICDFVDI